MNRIPDLARRFAKNLAEAVGGDTMDEIVRRNHRDPKAYPGDDVCHSHDFTDPNQVMLDSFPEVYKRPPRLANARDIHRINEAWSIAKRNDFWISPLRHHGGGS